MQLAALGLLVAMAATFQPGSPAVERVERGDSQRLVYTYQVVAVKVEWPINLSCPSVSSFGRQVLTIQYSKHVPRLGRSQNF